MASVTLLNVECLNGTAPFLTPLKFQITFSCVEAISDDLDWKLVYVGSPKSQQFDQTLDTVLVGPVPLGVSRFVLEAPAPDPSKIPAEDLLGATAVMLTCAYRGNEFVRVGYWVSNTYSKPLPEGEAPPNPCPPEDITRSVLSNTPRITTRPIDWAS